MSVLPKWLRSGIPTIPGHPVIIGPPGFQRATHKNRAGVNSYKKCHHFEKLRSGGEKTRTRCAISERSFAILMAVLKKIQSTGTSTSITKSPMMPRMKARSTGRSVLQMSMIPCLGGVINKSLKPGAGRSILT
ncbi:hypothetical protein CRG98_007640 [Punica granatum]|uniref:Uncharacterized protein n=1 Tax=Punica granatum TaxID=22663 RepID=A0A2I0KTZ5_PUNGR|nr:hypothetical protein CRG98_007640 [Punica granatum]